MTITRTPTPEGKAFAKAVQTVNKKVAKVGWFENSKYPEPPNVPVAYVATIHEFGDPTHNIPPRPFMRPTIVAKRNEWMDLIKQGVSAVLKGNTAIEDVMEAIGLKAAGDIRKTISLLKTPPLSPRTVAARLAKRSDKKTLGLLDKPLIDTGLMYGTLINTVENE